MMHIVNVFQYYLSIVPLIKLKHFYITKNLFAFTFIFFFLFCTSSILRACMQSCFSHVRICATLWTAAHQAPPSIGVSRQEYWSGLPFPSPQQSTNGNNYTANTYHYVSGTVFSHLLFHVLLTALCHIIL